MLDGEWWPTMSQCVFIAEVYLARCDGTAYFCRGRPFTSDIVGSALRLPVLARSRMQDSVGGLRRLATEFLHARPFNDLRTFAFPTCIGTCFALVRDKCRRPTPSKKIRTDYRVPFLSLHHSVFPSLCGQSVSPAPALRQYTPLRPKFFQHDVPIMA